MKSRMWKTPTPAPHGFIDGADARVITAGDNVVELKEGLARERIAA